VASKRASEAVRGRGLAWGCWGGVVGLVVGFAACGSGSDRAPSVAAVRVGHVAIATPTVDHWVSVLAAGRSPSPGTPRYRTLRSRAVTFLIASQWLIGEATDRGVAVSDREVKRGFREREIASFPGGSSELRDFVHATGETVADIEFEVKARLALARLRRLVASSAPPVTSAQVAKYYTHYRRRFEVPEQREVWITNTKTSAAAHDVKRRAAADKSFASVAQPENFGIAHDAETQRRRGPLQEAIASARLNELSGPVHDRVDYFVFEVKKIVPAHHKPLSRVASVIAKQLTRERRRKALAAFNVSWATKWTALTDCRRGYIVAPCRQYQGPKKLELGFGVR
jgi:hypothetical protein